MGSKLRCCLVSKLTSIPPKEERGQEHWGKACLTVLPGRMYQRGSIISVSNQQTSVSLCVPNWKNRVKKNKKRNKKLFQSEKKKYGSERELPMASAIC